MIDSVWSFIIHPLLYQVMGHQIVEDEVILTPPPGLTD